MIEHYDIDCYGHCTADRNKYLREFCSFFGFISDFATIFS